MPEIRAIIFLVFKISFVALVSVLMILWIVLGAQTVSDIKQLENTQNKNDRTKFYDKRALDRVKGMTIFNTILEEVIALLGILGVILSHRYLLHNSMILLAIIWFIAHYRITDLLWFGSPLMIASHIIHFFVVSIGLSFAYFIKESEYQKEKGSKIADKTVVTIKGA